MMFDYTPPKKIAGKSLGIFIWGSGNPAFSWLASVRLTTV